MSEPHVWEGVGNVVSLDQKRREMAERIEQDRVDGFIDGDIPTTVLCCECGCEALTLFSLPGELYSAQCLECGEPMILDILAFLGSEIAE